VLSRLKSLVIEPVFSFFKVPQWNFECIVKRYLTSMIVVSLGIRGNAAEAKWPAANGCSGHRGAMQGLI